VPAGSAGAVVHGTITVHVGGKSVSKRFAYRIR
jgi:hypothetical protein